MNVFHLCNLCNSLKENICTISVITIHYLYNINNDKFTINIESHIIYLHAKYAFVYEDELDLQSMGSQEG